MVKKASAVLVTVSLVSLVVSGYCFYNAYTVWSEYQRVRKIRFPPAYPDNLVYETEILPALRAYHETFPWYLYGGLASVFICTAAMIALRGKKK